MKYSKLEGARTIARKRAVLLSLIIAAAVAGSAIASCDETGPSPVGDHPDEAGPDTSKEEDAAEAGGEGGGEAGEAGGNDGGEDADAKPSTSDASDAEAGD
jgi:hypothetical protein